MTDIEIDLALAFAIGWPSYWVVTHRTAGVQIWVQKESAPYDWGWRAFSHKDWNVISPIAERYDCFPLKTSTDEWGASINSTPWDRVYVDTPQRAIAMAVIQGAKK